MLFNNFKVRFNFVLLNVKQNSRTILVYYHISTWARFFFYCCSLYPKALTIKTTKKSTPVISTGKRVTLFHINFSLQVNHRNLITCTQHTCHSWGLSHQKKRGIHWATMLGTYKFISNHTLQIKMKRALYIYLYLYNF